MLVQASQAHGRLVDLTTDGVPARERIDYWRDAVLRRPRSGSSGRVRRSTMSRQ